MMYVTQVDEFVTLIMHGKSHRGIQTVAHIAHRFNQVATVNIIYSHSFNP